LLASRESLNALWIGRSSSSHDPDSAWLERARAAQLNRQATLYMTARPVAVYAPLLLRVVLGSLFIAHLYWKLAVLPGGFGQWWANFSANGYPAFVPWYVLSAECAGALLLIPGVRTRWVSLYALPMMLGAAHFWAERKGFWFVSGGAELPAVWAIMLILQAMLGDGPYALGAGRRMSA
jgi:putative oxidoreductase